MGRKDAALGLQGCNKDATQTKHHGHGLMDSPRIQRTPQSCATSTTTKATNTAKPPKPPRPLSVPTRRVAFANGLMRSTSAAPASISTPADA
jgi:hypothetical protein